MQISIRHLIRELFIINIQILQRLFCFLNICTCTKNIVYQFILCNIIFCFIHWLIDCISNKVQTSHCKSLFIHCVKIIRIASCHNPHSNQCIMMIQILHMSKWDWIVSRNNDDTLTISMFIVQISSKIEIFCFIS